MKHTFTKDEIQQQKQKVFGEKPSLELVNPCRIGEGILLLSDEEKEDFANYYNLKNVPICFFIPSSGSGSRMFQFLHEFLEEPNDENRSKVELFINSIEEFAFYNQISKELQGSIKDKSLDIEQFAQYLLNIEGLGFCDKPKGLIPFHSRESILLNPFQEQILQGAKLENLNYDFHFTINSSFEKEIEDCIHHLTDHTDTQYNFTFSEQSIASNSIAFNDDGEIVLDEKNEFVTRPSGHGALLNNLNTIDKDLIFIKNIDNVQHINNSSETVFTWKILGGLLLEFKSEAKDLFHSPSKGGLEKLNSKYQLYSESEINACQSEEEIKNLLNRPCRVCGMVKNIGQAGGGPFWVKENGVVTKQIVEKAQISMDAEQCKLMVQSSHFNPVMIAASVISMDGNKFDLTKHKDDSKYFIVHKKQNGQAIRYIEQPGLWNGSMANWNTLFIEIPSETFSPVKTILDLLDKSHKE